LYCSHVLYSEFLLFLSLQRPNRFLSRFNWRSFWGFQATRTNPLSANALHYHGCHLRTIPPEIDYYQKIVTISYVVFSLKNRSSDLASRRFLFRIEKKDVRAHVLSHCHFFKKKSSEFKAVIRKFFPSVEESEIRSKSRSLWPRTGQVATVVTTCQHINSLIRVSLVSREIETFEIGHMQ